MTGDLVALAERVERASGADRELDLAVHHAIQPKRYRWAEFGGLTGLSDQRKIAVEVDPEWLTDEMRDWWLEKQDQRIIPAYTAFLDAAMSLVPDGWLWAAGSKADCGWAYVNNGELHFIGVGTRRNPAHRWYDVVAATPALALVSAALRARAQESGHG